MKLTGKEKVSYGLGAVGKDMVYMFSASYVLYYYQDILGVSAIAMGIILMAARVFDAFNDPIMGVVVAKTRTKWGKFRPWLFIGTLTNAVILYLMFAAPPKLDGNASRSPRNTPQSAPLSEAGASHPYNTGWTCRCCGLP